MIASTDDPAVIMYLSGVSIVRVARANHCRTSKITARLKKAGISAAEQRGVRIGNAQRGIPISPELIRKRTSLNTIQDTRWAFIAGLFDGEGSIGIDKYKNVRVVISQNGSKLHTWLIATLGAGAKYKSRAKGDDHYQFRLYAQLQVYQFLTNVLPYLIMKHDSTCNALGIMQAKYGDLTI